MTQAKIKVNGVVGSNTDLPVGGTVSLDNVNNGGEATFNWYIDYQPEGPADNFSNPLIQNPTFPTSKQDTYKITLVVNQGLSTEARDSVVLGVRRLKTRIRVPAATETTQASTIVGWAQDVNDVLDLLDTMRGDPGICVAQLGESLLSTDHVVYFSGTATIMSGLPEQQDVLVVKHTTASDGTNINGTLGLIVGAVDGGSLSSGKLAYVRRFGLHPVAVVGSVGATIFVQNDGSLGTTPSFSHSRAVGRIVSAAEIYFDGSTNDNVAATAFVAGGDLSGTATSQTVIGFDGVPLDASMSTAADGSFIQKLAGKWAAITAATAAVALVGASVASGPSAAGKILESQSTNTASWVDPSSIISGGVTPGTAGQVYITNSGPTAAWTSLVSVELTHGKFTAGGTGSDFKAVIGPLSTFETSNAGLWLLSGATVLSYTNVSVYSDGSSTFINTPSGSGNVGFVSAGTSVLAGFNFSVLRFYVGGFNTGAAPFIVDWASTNQTQVLAGSAQTSMLIGTTDAGATVDILADNANHIIQFAGGTQAGYALGGHLATAGHLRSPEAFAWLARRNDNLANVFLMAYSTDDLVFGDNSLQILQFISGGHITFNAGAAQYAQICADFIYMATSAGLSTVQVSPGAPTTRIDFIQCTNAAIILDAATSDVATGDITITAQAPFATATANKSTGNINLNFPSPVSGGSYGHFNLQSNGTTQGSFQVNDSAGVVSLITPNNYALQLQLQAGPGIVVQTTYMTLACGAGSFVYFGDNAGGTGWVHSVNYPAHDTATWQAWTTIGTGVVGTNKAGGILKLQGDAAATVLQLSGAGIAFSPSAAQTLAFSFSTSAGQVFWPVDTSSGAVTGTLPAMSSVPSGTMWIVQDTKGKFNTNAFSLAPNGTDTINGVNATVPFQGNWSMIIIWTDHTGWYARAI